MAGCLSYRFDPSPGWGPKGRVVAVELPAAARNLSPDNCPRVAYWASRCFRSRAWVPKGQPVVAELLAAARSRCPDNCPRVAYWVLRCFQNLELPALAEEKRSVPKLVPAWPVRP